jgi:hypothetical protein
VIIEYYSDEEILFSEDKAPQGKHTTTVGRTDVVG